MSAVCLPMSVRLLEFMLLDSTEILLNLFRHKDYVGKIGRWSKGLTLGPKAIPFLLDFDWRRQRNMR